MRIKKKEKVNKKVEFIERNIYIYIFSRNDNWMLDACWLQCNIFHVSSEWEQIEQYIKPIQKYDRDESTEATTFRLPLAKHGQLGLNEKIICL